jgi:hypothetical protein
MTARKPGSRVASTWVAALVSLTMLSSCTEEATPARQDSCVLFEHRHPAWNELLAQYVSAGAVDYAGLRGAGRPLLDEYLGSLESICRGHYDSWTREQKLAFWINAYNAYTVKLILEHYPLPSIRSIGWLPGAAFRARFIPLRWLDGSVLSLNHIEHEILRAEFKEPRIHFAIVCASESCPALASEAYDAETLDVMLTQAARAFVADETKNLFDTDRRTLRLSRIFKWFREDFEVSSSLQAFVAAYAPPAVASALQAEEVRVEFLQYDWSLNGK